MHPPRLVDPADLRGVALDRVAAVTVLARCGADDGAVPADDALPPVLRAAAARLGVRVAVPLVHGPTGRPFPHPTGATPSLDFNISHSGELVGVALGVGGTLGLDIQRLPGGAWRRLAARWLHPEEWARVQACAEEDGEREFTRVWAAREARCKATGRGMTGFRSSSPVVGRGGEVDGVWWRELPMPTGYAGALAWHGPDGAGWLDRDVISSWIPWPPDGPARAEAGDAAAAPRKRSAP